MSTETGAGGQVASVGDEFISTIQRALITAMGRFEQCNPGGEGMSGAQLAKELGVDKYSKMTGAVGTFFNGLLTAHGEKTGEVRSETKRNQKWCFVGQSKDQPQENQPQENQPQKEQPKKG